jgi:hypothetical protein
VNKLVLQRVKYMPRDLSPGILYVSEEYAVAGHLCACGCGKKVITPLGPAEWNFSERNGRPSLHPSIGSWQVPCRSHYVIIDGRIEWGDQWSEVQVAAGRRTEEKRRQDHYASIDRERRFWPRLRRLMRKLFGR